MARVLIGAAGSSALAGPPDHVVIVIEENHGFAQVIGSPEAPYMNFLAQNGASMTNMYGITHPSQPNYLQLYSGSNQGQTSNTFPAGLPFTTPNLGAAMIQAGRTFGGYCEGLPAVGSNLELVGNYARKHNPWVNWQAVTPGVNQLPMSTNMPFTSFPTDYATLPTLAIVVPDLQNDMHDGTIAQADAWLVANIKPYADWAMTHNSLLIVTWDEDNSALRNRIPTMFYGPMVKPGNVGTTWSLHHLLRTVEDMYGTTHAGAAAFSSPITGVFVTDPPSTTVVLSQGVNGYTSAVDTYIEQAVPAAAHGTDTTIVTDGSPMTQSLIRFDNLSASVPANSRVLSAKVVILTSNAASSQTANTMSLHRMLVPWSASSTWDSLVGGVSTDGVEAAASPDTTLLPNVLDQWMVFDVTGTVQSWLDGVATNYGWAVIPVGTDGWRWNSSEAVVGTRPYLEITYTPKCSWSSCVADFDGSGGTPDAGDIDAFFADWLAGAPCADADGSGGVPDAGDIDSFFAAWLAGGC